MPGCQQVTDVTLAVDARGGKLSERRTMSDGQGGRGPCSEEGASGITEDAVPLANERPAGTREINHISLLVQSLLMPMIWTGLGCCIKEVCQR